MFRKMQAQNLSNRFWMVHIHVEMHTYEGDSRGDTHKVSILTVYLSHDKSIGSSILGKLSRNATAAEIGYFITAWEWV